MPKRRKTALYGRKDRRVQKRKRQMEVWRNSNRRLASPHEGDLYIVNEVNLEPAIKRLFIWCYDKLPNFRSSVAYALSAFSSSRAIQSQLATTQTELDAAKQELARISKKLDNLESKMEEFSHQKEKIVPQIGCIVPPPPPPPPPPPLPALQARPLVFKKSTASAKVKSSENNTTETLHVSLDDILKVKLKKATDVVHHDKENKIPSKQPRVTLTDITSVTLKRRDNIQKQDFQTTPKSVLLQRTLRKTGMKRSPGGTPIIARDCTMPMGSGPTPEIERALRRKFRSLRTSPLTEDNSGSPRC